VLEEIAVRRSHTIVWKKDDPASHGDGAPHVK